MDISAINMYNSRMLVQRPYAAPLIEYVDRVIINRYWESEEHIRPVWKLYWSKRKGAALTFREKKIELLPDSFYLISPMTRYIPYCRKNVEHFYIHFKLPREYGSPPQGIWKIPADRFRYEQVSHTDSGFLLLEIICNSLRHLPPGLFDQNHPDPLGDLFIWLEEHLHETCRNSVLAGVSGYSEDTLNRIFIRETGLSPQKYVQGLRVSRAANLLKRTSLTIEEIAEQCGFFDRSHFHRIFQKKIGLSPVQFRKEMGEL